MDWNYLKYFLAVAEERTLLGASRRLEVNHSTVFRRIQGLEETTKTRLFDRLPDGYYLTPAGEQMLQHARCIAEEIDLLQLRVSGQDYRPSGNIRVTAPENLANAFLPGYLKPFLQQYPDIRIELLVGAESLDLTRREADLAVRATTDPPEHLVGIQAVTLAWAFYASAGYLEQAGWPEEMSDLQHHQLIGADGALLRIPPLRQFDEFGNPDIQVRCSTLNAISAMAEAGMGIALLPDDQVKPTLQRLFEPNPAYHAPVWLLTHPELRRTERIRLLRDHLLECFRSDPRLQYVQG